jgi:hypothetical protein
MSQYSIRIEKHSGKKWVWEFRSHARTMGRQLVVTVWLWNFNVEADIGWWSA